MTSVSIDLDEENFDYDDNMEGESSFDDHPPPKNTRYKMTYNNFGNFRNERYSNAYGNYGGGYGPRGGFGGYPRNFAPRPFYPPEPTFIWGRGFGPEGPPIRRTPETDKTIKYLMRCGVTKENLKNLPRDLLQLMEPDYCGLCAQSFDSFSMSQVHYISRNHQKNQKKWLTQHSEEGFYGPGGSRIPLKSRDLYCELCDVHITSKTHADSHYAGKPHRAIVEGRKNAKNPFLLQHGMGDRLEQLIRREKRFLKPVEETKELVEATDVKPVQPDLYCDICKTSVTCSEQMTMHLNGKKHLAKEKQYILRAMKGDGADALANIKEEPKETETAENAENIEAAAETQENSENFDWGNGSGTWDEPASNE